MLTGHDGLFPTLSRVPAVCITACVLEHQSGSPSQNRPQSYLQQNSNSYIARATVTAALLAWWLQPQSFCMRHLPLEVMPNVMPVFDGTTTP